MVTEWLDGLFSCMQFQNFYLLNCECSSGLDAVCHVLANVSLAEYILNIRYRYMFFTQTTVNEMVKLICLYNW